ARAQSHLGSELAIAGRTAEAILPLQRAIRIDPADHVSRRNLAVLLERERRWGEAADAWSDVLAVEPLNAEARCNLAFALQQGGRFQDAAAEYTQAFADAPSLAEDLPSLRRYDAARSAAAAASRGTTPHDASVSKVEANPADLRRQSLEWLRADLVGWREQLAEDDQIDTRFAVANVLGHWLNEPTLDPIRSPTALAQLPADERAEWEALWKSVRRMRSDAVPDTAVSAKVPTRLLGPSRNTVAKPIIAP
ncbi:MAG TPA: hypothetical protein VGE52_14395, partial [Pirellulales bacterium]